MEGQRGRRNTPQIYWFHSRIKNGALDRLGELSSSLVLFHKRSRARTQIIGEKELVSLRDPTLVEGEVLKIFKLGEGVDIDLELRQFNNKSPSATGSEFQ